MENIFVPIFLFGGIALVLWKYYDGRHRERMAMIEKGITPTQAQTGWLKQFVANPLSTLKWGLLAIFVGIGIFIGHWLHEVMGFNGGAAFFGSVLISGGVALVLYYFIASRKAAKLE
jgi:hypothetical protein